MPGPAPKHPDQRARRNATVAMTRLPVAGRTGAAPRWPLGSDVETETEVFLLKQEIAQITDDAKWETTARERAAQRRKLARANKLLAELEARKKFASRVERQIWAAVWKTPQATQWEKRGWFREVALYARHQAKAEGGSLEDSKEARQREDRLGLNDMSMLRLRWEIVDLAGSAAAPRTRSKQNAGKYRGLRVVGTAS